MSGFMSSVVTIFGLLITVAIIAAVISPKSQSAQVISAAFNGFSSVLKAAVSPVV